MLVVLVYITVVNSVELLDGVSTALRSIAEKLVEGKPVQVQIICLFYVPLNCRCDFFENSLWICCN